MQIKTAIALLFVFITIYWITLYNSSSTIRELEKRGIEKQNEIARYSEELKKSSSTGSQLVREVEKTTSELMKAKYENEKTFSTLKEKEKKLEEAKQKLAEELGLN